jgi:hypothetical protein
MISIAAVITPSAEYDQPRHLVPRARAMPVWAIGANYLI